MALNLQTAFLSPPVAMAAFYLKGVSPPHVTLNQIFAGMMPFMGIQVIALVLLYTFPDIGLWLPRADLQMKPKILVTREVFDETLAFLAQHCEVESNQQDVPFDPRTRWRAGSRTRTALMCALTDRVDATLLAAARAAQGGGQHRRRLQQHRRCRVQRRAASW